MKRKSVLPWALVGLLVVAAGAPAAGAEKSLPAKKGAAKQVLPWIEDDYPKALARARERDIPLFVEAWAPW